MKGVLLDTNACIALFKGNKCVIDNILKIGQENCFVSEITIAELYFGAIKSGRESHMKDVDYILQSFDVLPIFPCLKTYGTIKTDLEKRGRIIDEFDLLIASTAITNSLTVVTHNTKHFSRIKNLQVEDWEE